jgi:hypothetical protein
MQSLRISALIAGTVALVCLSTLHARAQAPSQEANSDELAVYAAVLDSSPKFGRSGHLLIADKTSTFACDVSDTNGLSIGGCNGLRGSRETPADRMSIVLRDLPTLQKSTVEEFEHANQQYVTLHHKLPSQSDYYFFNDPGIPKSWKYSFLVYFSRVGFNPEHTQALVNVGLFSAADANQSEGYYLVLYKSDGKWILGGTSAVWKLTPNE